MRSAFAMAHGLVDLLTGGMVISTPWLLQNTSDDCAIPLFVGAGIVAYSIFAAYCTGGESIARPFACFVGGVSIALCPMLMSFFGSAWVAELLFGTAELTAIAALKPLRVS